MATKKHSSKNLTCSLELDQWDKATLFLGQAKDLAGVVFERASQSEGATSRDVSLLMLMVERIEAVSAIMKKGDVSHV